MTSKLTPELHARIRTATVDGTVLQFTTDELKAIVTAAGYTRLNKGRNALRCSAMRSGLRPKGRFRCL